MIANDVMKCSEMIARIFAELNKPKRELLYVTSMKVSMF